MGCLDDDAEEEAVIVVENNPHDFIVGVFF